MQLDGEPRRRAAGALKAAGNLMGFLAADPADWFRLGRADGPGADEIEALLAARAAARRAKNFYEADRIRDALAAQGVVIEDGPNGASWRRI
jgi:cysteinyl-tRNA synthetase